MNISSVITQLVYISQSSGALEMGVMVTHKISEIALRYLGIFRQSGFFILGSKEALGAKMVIGQWEQIGKDEKVTKAFWKVVGGSALLISGIFGLCSTVGFLRNGYATPLNKLLFKGSNIFFLASSIVRLKTCLDDYRSAANREEEIKAMMGVGANLCYILAASLMLFGSPTTFVVVICCLGTATSLFQCLYEYLQRDKICP